MPTPNSTTRFSDRADNYDLYRPAYPTAVITWLQRTIGMTNETVVADIGSGTGIFSVLFLEAGQTVNAIEPNAAMRVMAENRLNKYAGFNSISGTAEFTELRDASVNLITAAQAFHWFNLPVVKEEFTRILRPGGYVLLAWNILQKNTAFLKAYTDLKEQYEEKNAHPDHADTEVILQFFSPSTLITHTIENIQMRDAAGLKGLLLSSSKIPQPGSSRYTDMMHELDTLVEQFAENGLLKLHYETKLYLSQMGSIKS